MNKINTLIEYCDLFSSDDFKAACSAFGKVKESSHYQDSPRMYVYKKKYKVQLKNKNSLGWSWKWETDVGNNNNVTHFTFEFGNGESQTIVHKKIDPSERNYATGKVDSLTFTPQNVSIHIGLIQNMRYDSVIEVLRQKFVKILDQYTEEQVSEMLAGLADFPSPPKTWLSTEIKRAIVRADPQQKDFAMSWRMAINKNRENELNPLGYTDGPTLAEVIAAHSELTSTFNDMTI